MPMSTAAPEYPADALRLAELHDLSPDVADRVLTVANQEIAGRMAQTLEDLAYAIEGELGDAERPLAGPIAEDATHLLGYRLNT